MIVTLSGIVCASVLSHVKNSDDRKNEQRKVLPASPTLERTQSERFYGKPVESKPLLNPSRSAISTVRHSSSGEIMARMGPLFKAKKETAAFVDRR